MSDFHLLQDLLLSQNNASPVVIQEIDDTEVSEDEATQPQTKKQEKSGKKKDIPAAVDSEDDKDSADTHNGDNNHDPRDSHNLKDSHRETNDNEPSHEDNDYEDEQDDDDEQQHDFVMDVEDARLEQLGTLLSAFFQDDRGFNVVDAIVQNSKVQNKIAKTLERIVERLESK